MVRKILLVRPNHTISTRALNEQVTRMNEEMKMGSVVILPDGWRATVVEVDVAHSSYLPNDTEWQLICEKRDQEQKDYNR